VTSRPFIGALSLLVLLSTTGSQLASASPPRIARRPDVIADWKARLLAANTELEASNWRKGASIADSVLREMRERIASGDESASLLAVALLFRAIGESGKGNLEDGAWDFGAAQALHPPYKHVDLTPYGAVAGLLDEWRYDSSANAAAHAAELVAMTDPAITPPRKLRGDPPSYPHAKSLACIHGPIVVQSVINAQGRLEHPYVAPGTDPVLALAAIDGIRDWRFVPAKRNDSPISVLFVLNVNFKLPLC